MELPAVRTSNRSWNLLRVLALFRDMQMHYDLHVAALLLELPPSSWVSWVSSRENADFQCNFWLQLVDRSALIQPSGTSAHSVSSAVEANYSGAFRRAFLEFACGVEIASLVMIRVPEFGVSFVYDRFGFSGTSAP